MASVAKISVKFFIDKEKNRVVFAEADKDFLDVLFSFLTLPMSTVIELISDSSVLESMTNVHKSVKSLDDKHMETKACKNMLLHPLSAGAFRCEDLKINIGNTNPRRFYHCSNEDCTSRSRLYISLVPDVRCSYCKKSMDDTNSWQKRGEDSVCGDGGGFVKGGEEPTFFIMDDLCVMPASVSSASTLLQKLGIRSNNKLEERILDLGKEEVSYLLKQSIISERPLTDICLHKSEAFRCENLKINISNTNPTIFYHCSNNECTSRSIVYISLVPDVPCSYCEKSMDGTNSWRKRKGDFVRGDGGVIVKGGEEPRFLIIDYSCVMPASASFTSTLLQKLGIKTKSQSQADHCEQISIKLDIDSANNRLLCAEVDGKMMNLLFSFLVLPIGSVIELLSTSSSMGCLDNLYRSVEGLGSDYMVSAECKTLLLSPKLPPFFSCSKNLLNVKEMLPREQSSYERHFINCSFQEPPCHLNPKKKKKVNITDKGGGYAPGRAKYILTDNLCVSPLTPSSILQAISDCNGTFSKILEREVVIGKVQALELLKAALTSKTPLTDVFLP